jgi:hypothetical protein
MQILGLIGSLLYIVSWIWLIIIGFKNSVVWGIINIPFQPITGLIFCLVKKSGWLPFVLMIVGLILFSIGYAPFLAQMMRDLSR